MNLKKNWFTFKEKTKALLYKKLLICLYILQILSTYNISKTSLILIILIKIASLTYWNIPSMSLIAISDWLPWFFNHDNCNMYLVLNYLTLMNWSLKWISSTYICNNILISVAVVLLCLLFPVIIKGDII